MMYIIDCMSHHKLVQADASVKVFVKLVYHCLQFAIPEAIIPELLRHALEVLDGDLRVISIVRREE